MFQFFTCALDPAGLDLAEDFLDCDHSEIVDSSGNTDPVPEPPRNNTKEPTHPPYTEPPPYTKPPSTNHSNAPIDDSDDDVFMVEACEGKLNNYIGCLYINNCADALDNCEAFEEIDDDGEWLWFHHSITFLM
jgi:hypothetical protein